MTCSVRTFMVCKSAFDYDVENSAIALPRLRGQEIRYSIKISRFPSLADTRALIRVKT